MQGPTVVTTVPEPSTTSLISNVHNYFYSTRTNLMRPSPVILALDKSDYLRIRRLSTEDKKYLYLYLALEKMRQYNVVYLIDYRQIYSGDFNREYYREKIKELVEGLSGDEQQNFMEDILKGWIYYARGEYQHEIRELIETNLDSFIESSEDYRSQLKKVERDGGDNQLIKQGIIKVIKKAAAALVVSNKLKNPQKAVKHLGKPVYIGGVIAGPEYDVPRRLALKDPPNVLTELGAHRQLIFPSLEFEMISRNIFKLAKEIAEDISNSDYDRGDFILGTRIGFLQPLEINKITYQFRNHDKRRIMNETDKALREITTGRRNSKFEILKQGFDLSELRYGSKYIFEDISSNLRGITDSTSYSFVAETSEKMAGPVPINTIQSILGDSAGSLTLSGKVREIKARGNIGDGALMIATSLALDPVYNYNQNKRFHDLYHWCKNLFQSPKEQDESWLSTQTKGLKSWTQGDRRWYE